MNFLPRYALLRSSILLSSTLCCLGACSAPASEAPPEDALGDGEEKEHSEEHVSLSERCDDSQLADASLRRLTAQEFQASLEDIFPEITGTWGGVALGADPIGISGFTNDARTLLVGPQSAEEIFRTALDVATQVTDPTLLAALLPCSESSADIACAGAFVDTYGERIYRRALSEAEKGELTTYFESVSARADFTMGLKWMIVAMLQSPFFIYRSELGDAEGRLSAEEIATQLSYMYTGSTPTPALVKRARDGEFSDAQSLRDVAGELLNSERGRALLDSFFAQWIGYESVRAAAKDEIENFAEVRESMIVETRAFLNDVVFASGGGPRELLTAPFTYVDALLAEHYGFGEPVSGFEKVERPKGEGIGLLAQGSFLAAKGHPTMSSPVFRGLFVFEKLLCQETPPVPEIVPGIEESPPANTTRERFELAHGTGACRSCHQAFEPLGFGLEAYDAAGRFRAEENGFPIDAAAELEVPTMGNLSFDGLESLASQLAESALSTDCISGQLAAYGYSGGGGEACLAEPERDALARGDYGLVEYYVRLAGAPSMTSRKR